MRFGIGLCLEFFCKLKSTLPEMSGGYTKANNWPILFTTNSGIGNTISHPKVRKPSHHAPDNAVSDSENDNS